MKFKLDGHPAQNKILAVHLPEPRERFLPHPSFLKCLIMNETRIIRVYMPDGKVAHVEMYCGDSLYSIPDHLKSRYPESFKGWNSCEIGLYHRAAGWVTTRLKAEDLSADLELLVVRRDISTERHIRQ